MLTAHLSRGGVAERCAGLCLLGPGTRSLPLVWFRGRTAGAPGAGSPMRGCRATCEGSAALPVRGKTWASYIAWSKTASIWCPSQKAGGSAEQTNKSKPANGRGGTPGSGSPEWGLGRCRAWRWAGRGGGEPGKGREQGQRVQPGS